MLNLKKCSFTFLILLISLSSVFARGKKDVTEEELQVIDTIDYSEETASNEQEEEIIDEIEPAQEEDESYIFDFSSKNVESINLEINKREYIFDFAPKKEQKLPKTIKINTQQQIQNPDECDKNGKTLLMQAIQFGNTEQIDLLLESNANINLQDDEGWTALMYCVRYQNDIDLVNKLLDYNANYKIETNYGLSLLDLCISYCDDLNVIKKILSLYEKNSKEVLKSFTLLLSSTFFDEELFLQKIQLFLNYNITLNSLHNGKTPLMYLCQNNSSTKAIQLLLKYGADKDIKSSENKTAFEYASENKSLQQDDIYWSLN